VIIPNGDLLNQHLMNWTLGSSRRRFEFIVGVAYGTDLEKTRQLLLDFMLTEHRILKHPHPEVLAMQFGNSSIDFVVRFWVPHFDIGLEVRSDLILAINKLFSEHGIVIPFPQQDVYIRSSSNPSDQPEK
jgi:potassium-dependent mechanosensitive channel